MDAETLERNLRQVRERIARAAERVGRDPAEVTLVAVTKTVPVEVIRLAYGMGLRDFGENRVEEALPKARALPSDVRWHCIGHVQRRKARLAVELSYLVHSVDSVRLAQRLQRFCEEQGRDLPILLEVNISGEETKYGFRPEEVAAAVPEIAACHRLRIQGLMTIAPLVADPEEARPCFRALRTLRDALAARYPDLDWRHLSMGMTGDFEVAVEEGATLVRIGQALFGPRPA
ncbi:MAG: YggS family pyridoxal phosphate-dependent enzyme [Anaerolineae bacterium]